MSARAARFEVVRSDAGWFARFVGANGRKVWQTEVYTRRRAAERAIVLAMTGWDGFTEVRDVNEQGGEPPSLDDAQALGKWALIQKRIADEINADRKIHAIKELRAATGASLYQSKTAIEAAQRILREREVAR